MVNIDEKVARLRVAAEAGEPDAARELGRLLCLTVADSTEPDSVDPEWPEERWLRAAVAGRPDDVEALTLLAGRLAAQASYWQDYEANNPAGMAAEGRDGSTSKRLWAEASDLHTRILAAGPSADAAPGLNDLAELLEIHDEPVDDEAAYSFYVLEDYAASGSMEYIVTVIATDPDEIRWACDQWLGLSGGGMGELSLRAYVDGEETNHIDLDEHRDGASVSWNAVPVPELTGTLLPAGLPVPDDEYVNVWHYGASVNVG